MARSLLRLNHKNGIPGALLYELTDALRILTEAGLETSDALDLASEIFTNNRRGYLVEQMRRKVAQGEPLSAALVEAGVPGIYSALVRIGEGIGGLGTVLPMLCDYLATKRAIREKLVSALIYPAFILVVLIIGSALILTLVAPRIIELTESLSGGDPALAATVSRMERLVKTLGGLFFALVSAPLILSRFKRSVEVCLLKLPGVGGFILNAEMMKLCFCLDALTRAGVPLEEALAQAEPVIANSILRREVANAAAGLLDGASPSKAFAAGSSIPRRFIRWLALGEQTGSPDAIFSGLKHYYRNEYEKRLTRMTGLIEPVLILFTGAVLFAAVLIFVVPLYSWYGTML